jgi:glycosyltransferase involved in cell wall biosynthesis
MLPRALRRCDGILTVSETSKREIVSVFGISPAIIHVVPNAVDKVQPESLASTKPLDDARPYLLMVGASWKHKNAMEVLKQHSLWSTRFRLKILAGNGRYGEQLRARSRELGISDIVDMEQGVTAAALASLYRGCSALVYPSTIEGFGLPPLEAMAWGKPVIVSDIPVFRELLRDVPVYVQLGNTESWKRAFDSLIDEELAENSGRVKARLALAASYSHERMCSALIDALKSIWQLEPNLGTATR